MTRDEIEKTKTGNLVNIEGHKNLLVSFGGIRQGLGIPVFEFFNSISDIECDKVFLRDFHQAWYQKGVDAEINHIDQIRDYLKQIIVRNNYEKVCFIGNSMGGYAAILFGTMLDINRVISFAPQTFIDPWNRLINFDFRWMREMLRIYLFKNKRKEYFDLKNQLNNLDSYRTEINLYYSTSDRLDKIHAERLADERNIVLRPIEEGGHQVVKVIRNNGELKSLIKSTFEPDVL